MAKQKKGALPLKESDLIFEVAKRYNANVREDAQLSGAQIKMVVKALKEETVDCLTSGYKVTLSGLLAITPSTKPGRKKGDKIINPFDRDAKPKTVKADEPDKFVVKARVVKSVLEAFPTAKSNDGQELLAQLTVPKKKAKKKAE